MAVGGLLVLAACGGEAPVPEAAAAAEEGESFARVINVEVVPVSTTSFTEVVRLTGTAQANRDVTVSAEESGVIREVVVEKGSPVRPGQAILRIDDTILRAQVDQARAAARLAQETWDRRKRLWEQDRVGSEIAYLQARYAAEQAAANLRALEERLERTVIRAPIAGILDARLVEVGTMVTVGTPVVRIVDLDPIKVVGGVPERFALDVQVGIQAEVSFDVLPDRAFTGRVSFVGSTVNPRNRTFPAELTLPNPGRLIKPEMVANITLVRRVLDDAVVVPQEALVRVEEGYVAFVVEGKAGAERAVARPVTPGPARENTVVVTEGLTPGDRLIVVGQQQVADGDRVRIVAGEGGRRS